jgi:hypothetical protein
LIGCDLGYEKIILKKSGDVMMFNEVNGILGKWNIISNSNTIILNIGNKKIIYVAEYIDNTVLIFNKKRDQQSLLLMVNESRIELNDLDKHLKKIGVIN